MTGFGAFQVADTASQAFQTLFFNLIEKIRAWLASNFLNDVLIDCFQVV
jgi:hypothetical protein